MNQPTLQRIRPLVKPLRRVVLHLLLVLVIGLKVGLPEAAPAYAQAATATSVGQSPAARAAVDVAQPTRAQAAGDIDPCDLVPPAPSCVTYPPPDLLYLTQGKMYAATPAQIASLRNFEDAAVQTVLALHGLPPQDDLAVRTWGRDAVLAQLYFILVGAINTDAAQRTVDQQNAVDWLTALAKRQNEAAAHNAAREYVKWAGLGRGNFDALMASNPTKDQIQTFLSGPVLNFDNTDTSLATEGWCKYRSPAPYGDEYDGYNNPICSSPIIGIVLPPTPTYDQFVQWGVAKAQYPLLSSGAFQNRLSTVGTALGIAVPTAAAVAGTVLYGAAAIRAAYLAATAAEAALEGFTIAPASFTIASQAANVFRIVGALSVALTLIAALATAIIVGINVTDAANLPGKLATLVDTARSTTPDIATYVTGSDSSKNLLSLFASATTPAPKMENCDNSLFAPPGMLEFTILGTDVTTLSFNVPCLNPTRIPGASATDPQFLVTPAVGSATLAPSITWKDNASNRVTTARLSHNWFITQANGTTEQTLRIAYTDWDGKDQNAWLIGDASNGYTFLTYSPPADVNTTLDPNTCVANRICGADPSIKYIDANGNRFSATVRSYQPPTGTLIVATDVVEGKPASFSANGFAPGGAIQPVTYLWEFKGPFCALDFVCPTVSSATGSTVQYTWQSGGTFWVFLTATDAQGNQATTRFQVPVAAALPTFTFARDCAALPPLLAVNCNTWSGDPGRSISLFGIVGYAGTQDRPRISMNWGDGTSDTIDIGSGGSSAFTITPVAGELAYAVAATHTYASAGIYQGSVTVTNFTGVVASGPVSRGFTFNIGGAQAITFPAISESSYGDSITISATNAASNQPVTFAVTSIPPTCALSNASGGPGTGSVTVTATGVGFCDITASQADATAPPSVTQRLSIQPAPLTVTASSATITYGQPVPAVTPSYSGFKISDTAAVLTAPATCAVPNSRNAGTYATTCSGAAALNYTVSYQSGTLTINKAPLTVTANNQTMVYGAREPVFDAQVSGLVNGDSASVFSGLICRATNSAGQQVRSDNTTPGSYPITCVGGNAANYTFQYINGTLTILKAPTTTALSASPDSTLYGQSVTFSARVTPASGNAVPTGTVAFNDNGSPIVGCTAQPLAAASATATCTTTALSLGTNSISATYSGDANYLDNSGAPTTISYRVAAVVAVRRAPSLNSGSRIEGPLWLLSGESTVINGGTVAGDLLVPGSPTVNRNGGSLGSTVTGSGNAQPSSYSITFNSGSNVNRLVTRTNAVALPTVPPPPVPSGTRDVMINQAGQSIGNPATLRNITLNSGAGAVSLPAGTYGRLTANSGGSFVLGVVGAGTPSVYNLQELGLSGGRVQIVGPVVINLANGFSLNSGTIVGGQANLLVVNVAAGSVALNGGTFFGTLRAPASRVTLNSGSRLEGMLLVDRLNLNGGTVRTTP